MFSTAKPTATPALVHHQGTGGLLFPGFSLVWGIAMGNEGIFVMHALMYDAHSLHTRYENG